MIRLDPKRLRTAGSVAGVLGVVLAVLLARVVFSARSENLLGARAESQNDTDAAIVHYRRAARWYAPGNPYCRDGLEALARLGAAAEGRNDPTHALSAWRGVRGAVLATRSFYTPHTDMLERANRRIADLMSGLPAPPIDAGKSRDQLRTEHLALLTELRRPHVGWTLLLLAGFFTWIGSAFAFASRAFDEHDRLIGREAKRWATAIACGLAAFVIGMVLA